MAKHRGRCVTCNRGDNDAGIIVDDQTNQCIICRRLDKIEEKLSPLVALYEKIRRG